jgi:hypothetical protein
MSALVAATWRDTRRRRMVRCRGQAGTSRRAGELRIAGEGGSALVEFVFLAVLVVVPLLYLVLTLSRLQAGAYAVSAAAREAGRAYVTADSADAAPRRAEAAARLAFEDQGFSSTQSRLDLSCDGSPCLHPAARVTMVASVRVPLPLVPAFARAVIPLEISESASHVAVVDPFRGMP